MKKIIFTAILLILATVSFGCVKSYDAFRLHVIANSNSSADQSVKLLVRDEVLESMPRFESKQEGYEFILNNIEEINSVANGVLKEQGFNYTAKSCVGTFEFPDKEYAGEVYPAGEYEALRVVLGDGAGENWWCVIFPPLCVVPGSEKVTSASPNKVEYKSAVGEFFNNIFGGK